MQIHRRLLAVVSGLCARNPPKRGVFDWNPKPIGPRFDWLDHAHIRLLEGSLSGEVLEVATNIAERAAGVSLFHYGKQIGQAFVEREPPTTVVLWDIGVRDEYRRKGLASVMAYCIFREFLHVQALATFKIRMVRLIKPGDRDVELQNVGIGVIANRLGFTPELDIDRLLSPGNVTGIEVIPAKGGFPPGLKLTVRTFPLVFIGFVLDKDTQKPIEDYNTYVSILGRPGAVYDWVRQGHIVISNGNYELREDGLDRFVNGLAADAAEAQDFRRRILGL